MATRPQSLPAPGDMIEVSGRRLGDGARSGEILEVLGGTEQPHFLVRWEDGHESVLYSGERVAIKHGGGHGARAAATAVEPATPTALLVTILSAKGVDFELLPHRRTTSATGEARALGVLPQTVAKTVILRSESGECIRAVVPAAMHVDLERLSAVAGSPATQLNEEELVSAYPQFELGAVPPFGGPAGDRVVLDRRLTDAAHVVFDGGVHDTSVRLAPTDLVEVAEAEVADIART
jgi:Ala-tRNA(Pro) deacylase